MPLITYLITLLFLDFCRKKIGNAKKKKKNGKRSNGNENVRQIEVNVIEAKIATNHANQNVTVKENVTVIGIVTEIVSEIETETVTGIEIVVRERVTVIVTVLEVVKRASQTVIEVTEIVITMKGIRLRNGDSKGKFVNEI